MLFSSIIFLFYFLPITMALYFIVPARMNSVRNVILLIASLFFYSWGEPVYVLLMIYSIFFNYFMAVQIGNARKKGGTGKSDLVFTVVVNLFILGFFKYFGFIMDTFNSLTGLHVQYTKLALPIGISFYTFQALSYIFDVYRDKVKPQRNVLKFALYLSMFPQLIAGPIVKYRDVEEQIDSRTCSMEKIGAGAERFILGLGKKVILANTFGSLYSEIGSLPDSKVSVLLYWIGIIAYTFQIYFDFSGYSDMAIGLGKIFGFDFNENFNYPYISKTVTEFWRRWHMSLSTWFREYVYIPLGGNRVTVPRHIFNLMVVWALTGLWHGADWNFILWGTYYGVVLVLEKYIYGRKLAEAPDWLQHVYTMLVVVIGWAFFSITDIDRALEYIGIMFGAGKFPLMNMTTLYYIRTNLVIMVLGGIFSTPAPMRKFREFRAEHLAVGTVMLYGVLGIAVAFLVYGSYNPFLYFRF